MDKRKIGIIVWSAGVGVLTVAVIGSVLYIAAHGKKAGSMPTFEPTASASTPTPQQPVATVSEVTPSSSASAVPSPASSPTPTATQASLPESAKTVLANFYAAFSAKDRDRLASFFTPDTTDALRSQRSSLFSGVDLSGNPTAPLFDRNGPASEVATGYQLSTALQQGTGWTVTVREHRTSRSGQAIPDQTKLITMVPAPSGQGTWLIDAYAATASSGKYDGFLLE